MKYLFALLVLVSSFAFGGVNVPSYGGAPYMQATLGTTQTVTASTKTTVNFDTVAYDSGGYFNTTTHRYTPLVAGKFLACAGIQTTLSNVTAVTAVSLVYLQKNSVDYQFGGINATAQIGVFAPTVCTIIPMNGSTDYINVAAFINGTANTITSGLAGTVFSVMYVGP